MVGQPAGKLEHRFGRSVVTDQFGGAFPADFDPCEQIGFRARHAIEALWAKTAVLAENRRSEGRRVGKECFSPCRSRWSPYQQKQTTSLQSPLYHQVYLN